MIQHFQMAPSTPVAPWFVLYAPAFSAAAVFVIGLVAATIAYRQWRTAHTKVQIDLYSLRFPTYRAVRDFLAAVAVDAVKVKHLHDMRGTMEEASFLFNDRVAVLLEDLIREGWQAFRTEHGYLDDDDEFHDGDPQAAFFKWVMLKARRQEVFEAFGPFLRLEDRNNVAVIDVLQQAVRIASKLVGV